MRKTLFILFLSTLLSAQETRIIEVLDANLFRTEDSTLISMVNLDVPSINDPDSLRAALAKNIVTFAKHEFRMFNVRFEKTVRKCSQQEITYGHIFKIFTFSDKNMNATYLKNGYAVYLPCDTSYMELYTDSAKKGMETKKGIWKTHLVQRPVNYFNRFRLTWMIFPKRDLFYTRIPLLGFNYRWSDLYTIYKNANSRLSLSTEVGTIIYIIPNANFGGEFRFKYFYIRAHYSLFRFFYGDRILRVKNITRAGGYDLGFYIPIGKRNGLEFEINIQNGIIFDQYYFFTLNIPFY